MKTLALALIMAGLVSGKVALAVDAAAPESATAAVDAAPVQPPSPAPAAVPAVKFSGVIQAWALVPQQHSGDHTFRFRRTALRAEAEPAPGISAVIMMDPAQVREDDRKPATGLVTETGRKSPLQDAIIAFSKPFGGCGGIKRIQAGQFKTPFGMDGMRPETDVDTAERALVSTAAKWSDQRDIGVQAQAGFGPLDVWGGAFNGEGQNRAADANNHVTGIVRAVWKVCGGCAVGASYEGGRKGAASSLFEHTGAELAWAGKPAGIPVRASAEFAFGASGPKGKATFARTGYAMAAAGVWPGRLDLVGKFDWYDPTRGPGTDWMAESTAGATVHLSPKTKLQWNYVFKDEGAKVHDDLIRINLQTAF